MSDFDPKRTCRVASVRPWSNSIFPPFTAWYLSWLHA